jgi:hypothetical protein
MDQRARHHKKPVGKGQKSDVIYNTDGRGAPKVEKRETRMRWEPFKAGTN